MRLRVLPHLYAICRLDPEKEVPPAVLTGPFFSITRTPVELSILCAVDKVPRGATVEAPWKCLEVIGPLDFALTGVLSSLAAPLANAAVSIFAVSTYNTDYLLVHERDLDRAIASLRREGHLIESTATPPTTEGFC